MSLVSLTRTRRELIEQVLENLGAIVAGQPAEVEDVQRLEKYIDPALSAMATNNIYFVGDSEEIPNDAFLWVAMVIADFAKSGYGRAGDQTLTRGRLDAEDQLKTLTRPATTRPKLRTEGILSAGTRRPWQSDNEG